MKFNWGTGIIITFILFAAGMIWLVTLCTSQNHDLVSIDYYSQELKYQNRIDARENADNLSKSVTVNYDGSAKETKIIFPDEFKSTEISGTLHFFRPDNASLDFNTDIRTECAEQSIPASHMKTGLWRIQLQWTSNNISYYTEQNLVIN